MTDNPFVGSWIYRSLLNDSDISKPFNDLRLAAATITIQEAAFNVLKGEIGGEGWSLALQGSREYGTPMRARFQGNGIIGGERWIYDYDGYLVPHWPDGVDQRPAIVGSLIRTVPHSGGSPGTVSPAGVVFSFYAVRAN
jgi:hypothetical protein